MAKFKYWKASKWIRRQQICDNFPQFICGYYQTNERKVMKKNTFFLKYFFFKVPKSLMCNIHLTGTAGFSFMPLAPLTFSSRATKKPCVRVLVVLALKHCESGSCPRSGHWASSGTNLERKHKSCFVRFSPKSFIDLFAYTKYQIPCRMVSVYQIQE